MSRKLLVTGGTGFIGRALVPALLARDHEVRVTGRGPHNDSLAGYRGCRYFRFDLDNSGDIPPEMLDRVDTVIHLAARVHVMDEDSHSLEEFRRINSGGTRRLAEAAAGAGARRFIFLSTVKVHGEKTPPGDTGEIHRFTETDPLEPEDAYATSKLEAEKQLIESCRTGNMEYVIFRPPLVYGPGVKANFLRLLNLVYKGYPLPFSSLDNRRSMIYSGNLADAICNAVDSSHAADRAFLVRDVDVTLGELVRKAGEYLGRPARLFPFPERLLTMAGKILRREATISRLTGSLLIDDSGIRDRLDWSPPFTFDEGIEDTARWYLENFGHKR